MPQRHVQRLMGAFERKNLLPGAVCILITLVEDFGDGKEFDTELCTYLLPFVDDPMIPVVVRMDICVGQLCNVEWLRPVKAQKTKTSRLMPVR